MLVTDNAVTFGLINDDVVSVSVSSVANPTPKLNKVYIRKLFQNSSAVAAPLASSPISSNSSRAPRSAPLPSSLSPASINAQAQTPVHAFQNFVPSAGFRRPGNIPNISNPSFSRQNGTSGDVDLGNQQSGTPGDSPNQQNGMLSPRLSSPHQGQPQQPISGFPQDQPFYLQYYVSTLFAPSLNGH